LTRINLTVKDFEGQILKDQVDSIAVLFKAEWCPFCRAFIPIFETLQESGVPSGMVDLSEFDNPLWETFNIDIVPTVLLFKDGKIVQRYDGVPGEGLNAATVGEIISYLKPY